MVNGQGQRVVELKIRLYAGRDDDLIEWLRQFDEDYGVRGWAVRAALRRGIGGGPASETAGGCDLSEIRRVVEAAVSSALARCGGRLAPPASEGDDEETEGLLDSLGAALVLEE